MTVVEAFVPQPDGTSAPAPNGFLSLGGGGLNPPDPGAGGPQNGITLNTTTIMGTTATSGLNYAWDNGAPGK